MATGDNLKSLMLEAKAASARLDRLSRKQVGQCRTYVGKVYNGGLLSTSGDRYVLTRPVAIPGDETEGMSSTLVEDSSQSVPVLVIGQAPTAGAIIVADLIDGRWVAENTPGSGGGPGGINIPGCFCQGTPPVLNLSVTFGPGETSATYGNAYQDCILNYYDNASYGVPSYGNSFGSYFPGRGYYSTTTWIDDYGGIDYFYLSCFSSQYSLGLGQYAGGLWQSPGQIYNWGMGTKNPVNFCNPFGLLNGQKQSGITFNGKFTIMG